MTRAPVRATRPLAPKAIPVPEEPGPPDAKPDKEPPKPATSKKPPTSATPEQNLFDYANMCYGQKSYDLAIQQYHQYLNTYPRGEHIIVATYRLAEAYLNASQVTEAEATYRGLIQRFKTGDYVANAAYRLASLAYNKRNFEAAIPHFETASAQTKQEKIRLTAIYYKARCLGETGEARAAYTEFERLVKTKANNPFWDRAMIQLARADEAGKRTESALTNYSKLAAEGVDAELRAEALVKSARMLKDGGKTTDAVASFHKVLQLKDEKAAPWRAIARYGLIESYHKAGEWQKVIESYASTEAVQLPEEQRPRLWLMVGDAQSKLKQHRRAIDLFLMIDQYYPNSPENGEAGYRRLISLNELKDPSLPTVAEQVIDRIKSVDPGNEQIDLARFILAEHYFSRQAYPQAAAAYKNVRAEKLPQNLRSALLYRRGWSSEAAGDHATAIAAFGQFLEQNPKDPDVPQALAKRGLAYKASEDWKSAQADFDRLITEFSKSPVAELAYEQSALIKGQRKDTAGMIATFEEMLKKFPQSRAAAEAWFWIGSGHFEMKKYPQAVTFLEKARQAEPRTYERDASLRILLSYYYLSDLKNLVKAVETERLKDSPETRVPKDVYQYLGLKYFELEDMPLADKYLTYRSTPEHPEETDHRMWFMLSEARLANGHWDGALIAADHYLRRPDLPPPQRAKGMLNKARSLFAIRKFAEATPLINEALRLQPEARVQAHLRLLLGDIYMAEGDPAHAAQVYVLPSQMFDDEEITPLALWKTVRALEKAGKSAQADEYRADLKKRFPKFKGPVRNDRFLRSGCALSSLRESARRETGLDPQGKQRGGTSSRDRCLLAPPFRLGG